MVLVIAFVILSLTCYTIALNPVCLEKRDVGNYMSNNPSWYFDSEAKECRYIRFGGPSQSRNHFTSLEECQRECEAPNNEIIWPW